MRLTQFTDYGLRVLMHLSAQDPTTWVSVRSIAEFYSGSREHFAKVTSRLAELGWVESKRGRSGGVRLAREPASLSIAEVIRALEPPGVLACFEAPEECRLGGGCGLRAALQRAECAFFASLEGTSLADCVSRPGMLTLLTG